MRWLRAVLAVGSMLVATSLPLHAARAATSGADVLISEPGAGFAAAGDTSGRLGMVTRHFTQAHGSLDLTVVPAPGSDSRQLFSLMTSASAGLDPVPEPVLDLGTWFVSPGTAPGADGSAFLAFASKAYVFTAVLTVDASAGLDPKAFVLDLAQRQIRAAGGAPGSVTTTVPDRAASARAALLESWLPSQPPAGFGLSTAETFSGADAVPSGVGQDALVARFLADHTTTALRIWSDDPGDLIGAVSITSYPYTVFAGTVLSTTIGRTDAQPLPIGGLDAIPDVVTFALGSGADAPIGATFRRGPYVVTVLAQHSSAVPEAQAAALVRELATDTSANLPAGGTRPYRLPGARSTAAGMALSALLVSASSGSSVGVGRLRARRLRRRSLGADAPTTPTPVTAGGSEDPHVIDLDRDAHYLRRRAAGVLVGQLVSINIGVIALAGDFGWTGVVVAGLSLIAGLLFTAWWRTREHGALGPSEPRPSRLAPRPIGALVGILALAVLGVGVAFGLKGLRYLILAPTLAQLKWSDLFGISPRAVGGVFAGGGLVLAIVGAALFRAGRALSRASTPRLLAADHRSPVLYLRSFEDDSVLLPTIVSARRPMLELFSLRGADPFEESIAWELDTYGPVVAVGRPGHSLASLGAAREHLSDDTWREHVSDRMQESGVIVVATGATEGLRWELGRLVSEERLARTVFVFPPLSPAVLSARWDYTSSALVAAGAPVAPLPAAAGRVHTAQIRADGSVIVTVAGRRDEASYRTAIDRALALAAPSA